MNTSVSHLRFANPSFHTARLADQGSGLLVQEIANLRRATRGMLARFPTRIDAVVVLPNVIHTIWRLPDGDTNTGERWDMLRALFSGAVSDGNNPKNAISLHERHPELWQSNIRTQNLGSDEEFAAYRDLILTAPVHYGLVSDPADWPHSSIHRDIAMGLDVPAQRSAFSGYVTGKAIDNPLTMNTGTVDFGWASGMTDQPEPLSA